MLGANQNDTRQEEGWKLGKLILPKNRVPDAYESTWPIRKLLTLLNKLDLLSTQQEAEVQVAWNNIHHGMAQYFRKVRRSRKPPRKSRVKKAR